MIDWTTVANLGTAGGTALLAVATFFSTRSANAAARSAERSVLEGLRPVLIPSRWEDSVQKVHFFDGRWVAVRGGRAVLDATDEAVYLVLSLRNPGHGLAVLHGWDLCTDSAAAPRDAALFRRQTRDIYVPAGEAGFCQIAVREPGAEEFRRLSECLATGERFGIDVLYSDAEGGQRMITRMGLTRSPASDSEDTEWAVSAARHWHLDRPNPR
jgi:hypothetical protein